MRRRREYIIFLQWLLNFSLFFFRSRAKIVKLEPLTVFFIDFGNDDTAELKNVYPMPKKFLDIPPLVTVVHYFVSL